MYLKLKLAVACSSLQGRGGIIHFSGEINFYKSLYGSFLLTETLEEGRGECDTEQGPIIHSLWPFMRGLVLSWRIDVGESCGVRSHPVNCRKNHCYCCCFSRLWQPKREAEPQLGNLVGS